METIQHKYHAEVKSKDCLVRINIFAEDLPSLFKDLDVVFDYMGYEEAPTALATTSLRGAERRRLPQEARNPLANNNNNHTPQPPCPHCGAANTIELVKWTDKTTGQPRQAPKCQSCSKWIR
jgi:hypothetical protein